MKTEISTGKTVAAHKSEVRTSIENTAKEIAEIPLRLKEIQQHAGAALDSTDSVRARGAWALHVDKQAARRLFSLSVDCSHGALLASSHHGSRIEFPFEGVQVAVDVPLNTKPVSCFDWVEALSLALCFRRTDTLELFQAYRFPVPEKGADPFWLYLARTHQTFLMSDSSFVECATRTLELATKSLAPPKYVAKYVSLVPALQALRVKNQSGFTDALVGVLEAHKAHDGRGADRNTGLATFSYLACGMAAVGLDLGLRLEVESGYMPEWLVRNEAP